MSTLPLSFIKGKVKIRYNKNCRLRVMISSLKTEKSSKVQEYVQSFQEVVFVKINPFCCSLTLIVRTPEERQIVLKRLEQAFSSDTPTQTNSQIACACQTRRTIKNAILEFASLSAVTAFIFVRETILKQPFTATLTSPLGLISLVASIPLWQEGITKLKQKTFSLDLFLAASCTTASIAGEALTALEILWINSGSHLVKDWITERSRNSIREILQVTTKNAFILVDETEVEIPADQLAIGNLVIVHSGEKIPVDGTIERGEAMIDEASISGRGDHLHKKEKDTVFAGTFVRQGVIYIRATKVGDDTYLSRILHMVEDNLQHKAPIEGAAEDLARKLIKLGTACTLGTLIFTQSPWRAFTVMLVMACPCATVLSASTAVSAALSLAAKRHILIKGGRYLEEVSQADIVCFDKTGTLTTNQPTVSQIVPVGNRKPETILKQALIAEQHNTHPVAEAIKLAAIQHGIPQQKHARCDYHMGQGVEAQSGKQLILVGNEALLEQFDINYSTVKKQVETLRKEGKGVVYLAVNKSLHGYFAIDNTPRIEAKRVLAQLKKEGVKTVLLTGDEEKSAATLCARLEMDEFHASVLPQQKEEIVSELKKQGKVLMIGDGINDALALAAADIGIAMGAGGTEVAIEAADIALVKDDLQDIIFVRNLSRQSLQIVQENFWIASGSNLIGVVLGSLGMLPPVGAGLLHIAHSLGVLANSSRLLKFSPDRNFYEL